MDCYIRAANKQSMSVLQFYVDYCKGVYFIMSCSWYIICAVFCIVPLLLKGKNFPTGCAYPFAIDENPVYELVYAHQTFSIFQVGTCMCTNNLVTLFLWYAISRLDLVSTQFRDVKTAADFRKSVQAHKYILR